MVLLPMATPGTRQKPAIPLKHFYQFPDFHCFNYTEPAAVCLTWRSMDGELGALAASERSEHAPGVRRFTVHWIVSLGAPFCLYTVG
jgi:hypothetical protein